MCIFPSKILKNVFSLWGGGERNKHPEYLHVGTSKIYFVEQYPGLM